MRARQAGVVANLKRQVGLAACKTLERCAFPETKAKNNLYRHTSAKGGESDIIHHNKRHQGKKELREASFAPLHQAPNLAAARPAARCGVSSF